MNTIENVKDYYGKKLQKSADLKTNACCTIQVYPPHIKSALGLIHDEVNLRYFGCGLTIPNDLKGRKVLDLGSGAGRDCFVLSKLVGEFGEVVGVDMTREQLDVANKHIDYHTKIFGYKSPNVRFIEGQIEKLGELSLKDDYFDAIVSNCVINLCQDKEAVLREAFRVLKHGGELFFSDVYADRRIPAALAEDPLLWGECLSGALYWNDFLSLAKKVGFNDPRVMEVAPITIDNEMVKEKCGNIEFVSVTYRLFKLPELESDCEDYGQSVIYKGTIPDASDTFWLDGHHEIKKGETFRLCGNSWRMLHDTRFNSHFEFKGDFSTHLGIFEGCGGKAPWNSCTPSDGSLTQSCC